MADKAKILLLYCIFFLLLFLQFPLEGCLAGRTDCWWHLATFLDFGNRLSALIHHTQITTSYYPAKALWQYGEPSFGAGSIYLIIHDLVPDFIWSFYLLYTVLFSLTAFTFYLLAGEFVSSRLPRFAGGLFFTASNFFLGQIDHHNTFFWAIAFLSIICFYRFIHVRKPRWLYLTFLFWGLQIYFSTTIFIYLSLWITILLIVHHKACLDKWRHFIPVGILWMALIIPLVSLYLFNPDIKNAYNPSLFAKGSVTSNLWPRDLMRFLPGNVIYATQTDISFDLLYNIKCAAPGIILLMLFLTGLRYLPRRTFLPIALAGIILAVGAEVKVGHWLIPMPMKLYYSTFRNLPFLRTPIRAYFLVHWVLCTGAVFGLNRFTGSLSRRLSLILTLLALFLIENVPLRLPSCKAGHLISESKDLSGFLMKQGDGNILHLPSQIFPAFPIQMNAYDMNPIGREYFYSFDQALYKRNTVNGSAGYFPTDRIQLNDILQLRSAATFKEMLKKYDIKFVILHRDLMLPDELPIADSLAQMSFLHPVAKVDSCIVFSVE